MGAVRRRGRPEPPWLERLWYWIQQHPTFGCRRLWVQLQFRDGAVINRKAVYRALKQQGWLVHQRVSTLRPRVQYWTSQSRRSNKRWAMDVTHIACGRDGWAHLAAIIDCHDRERISYELALRSLVKEAERGLEGACLDRLGDAPTNRGSSPAQQQRADLPESAVSPSLLRLSTPRGIHHTLHPVAERDY